MVNPSPTEAQPVVNDTPLDVLWRRKWFIVATFLVFVVATGIVSKTLPKVYQAEATLLVAQPAKDQTFDTVQASQAVARSYGDIIDSPNIALLVSSRLGGSPSRSQLLDTVSFDPVPETQLLKINAENRDPARAKAIANAYADVFIGYARTRLEPTTKAIVSVADRASVPRFPVRPRPVLYVALAAVVGLVLGTALAFLVDRLDRRLRRPEDVEALVGLPLVGRIPLRGRSAVSRAAFEEAFRVLRTNLDFATMGEPLRSLAVVSQSDSEGKTTVSSELARAITELGHRVVAVEADLRRPALQSALLPGSEPLQPGLSQYLIEAAALEDIVHPTDVEHLSLVPSGPLPPSPSALLESERGRRVFWEFQALGEMTIVDCPPFAVGADTALLSSQVDGVILVVDLQSASIRAVREALRQLNAAQARVLGVVVNRDRTLQRGSYDYYLTAGSKASEAHMASDRG